MILAYLLYSLKTMILVCLSLPMKPTDSSASASGPPLLLGRLPGYHGAKLRGQLRGQPAGSQLQTQQNKTENV